MAITHYQFQNGEIGVMTEFLLPKKIEYQGKLFDSLVNGLNNFSYNKYFRVNKTSAEYLLKNYKTLKDLNKINLTRFDKDYNDIFQGYSMYEVDGVYLSKTNNKSKIGYLEERTQIVRFYFIPNYEKLIKKLRQRRCPASMEAVLNFADIFFKKSKITSFEKETLKRKIELNEVELEAIESKRVRANNKIRLNHKGFDILKSYFLDWSDAIALMVFGYLVHEITLRLNDISKKRGLRNNKAIEEEIWVTTHWGVIINKINFVKE